MTRISKKSGGSSQEKQKTTKVFNQSNSTLNIMNQGYTLNNSQLAGNLTSTNNYLSVGGRLPPNDMSALENLNQTTKSVGMRNYAGEPQKSKQAV